MSTKAPTQLTAFVPGHTHAGIVRIDEQGQAFRGEVNSLLAFTYPTQAAQERFHRLFHENDDDYSHPHIGVSGRELFDGENGYVAVSPHFEPDTPGTCWLSVKSNGFHSRGYGEASDWERRYAKQAALDIMVKDGLLSQELAKQAGYDQSVVPDYFEVSHSPVGSQDKLVHHRAIPTSAQRLAARSTTFTQIQETHRKLCSYWIKLSGGSELDTISAFNALTKPFGSGAAVLFPLKDKTAIAVPAHVERDGDGFPAVLLDRPHLAVLNREGRKYVPAVNSKTKDALIPVEGEHLEATRQLVLAAIAEKNLMSRHLLESAGYNMKHPAVVSRIEEVNKLASR